MSVSAILVIAINAMLIENFVLVKFLGICPFLGVSKKLNLALGMGAAVTFVMTLASAFTWIVNNLLLIKFDLMYLQTIAFILVIASLVQFVEMVLKKFSYTLYSALGIYLPLITTNCAILGVTLLNVQKGFNLVSAIFYGFFSGLGFMLALIMFTSLRERLKYSEVPKPFQGFPIALVTASLLSMAFMGFQGIKLPF